MKFDSFLNEASIRFTPEQEVKSKYAVYKGTSIYLHNFGGKEIFIIDTNEDARALVLEKGKLIDDYIFDEDEWKEDSSKAINDFIETLK